MQVPLAATLDLLSVVTLNSGTDIGAAVVLLTAFAVASALTLRADAIDVTTGSVLRAPPDTAPDAAGVGASAFGTSRSQAQRHGITSSGSAFNTDSSRDSSQFRASCALVTSNIHNLRTEFKTHDNIDQFTARESENHQECT